MTAQGFPRTRFTRAVAGRNIFLAELSAREMGHLPIEDALSLVALYAAERSPKFERAAARLLARAALERDLRLSELQLFVSALSDLPSEPQRSTLLRSLLTGRDTSRAAVSTQRLALGLTSGMVVYAIISSRAAGWAVDLYLSRGSGRGSRARSSDGRCPARRVAFDRGARLPRRSRPVPQLTSP